jgi:hypothetical protein
MNVKNVNTELSYDPEIPPPGIYAKELKIRVQTKTYRSMFVAMYSQ